MKAVSNIDAWRVLAAIAEGNGITGASESTGIDLPACTRLIKKLEEELGYALVEHQVRPARLTDFVFRCFPPRGKSRLSSRGFCPLRHLSLGRRSLSG